VIPEARLEGSEPASFWRAMLAIATAFFQASEPRSARGKRPRRMKENCAFWVMTAHRSVGIAAGGGAVQHHLGDGELALDRLAAGFEINRIGEAFLLAVGRVDAGISEDEIGQRVAGWGTTATTIGVSGFGVTSAVTLAHIFWRSRFGSVITDGAGRLGPGAWTVAERPSRSRRPLAGSE
jgi:hypothetical protein